MSISFQHNFEYSYLKILRKSYLNTIKEIYKEYTRVPMKKLDEILKHDLWFDSKTSLKLGLVDDIV